jgi:steroid 5-alpha reductase family enzyme
VLGVMISMHIFFIIGTINKNHTIVDFAWGLSFVIVAHISFWMNFEFTLPRVLVLLMVTVWGLRLAGHIHIRSHGQEEDERYAFMRESLEKRGHALLQSYLRIYLMQGLMALIIAAPIVMINGSDEKGFTWLYILGTAIWLFGFTWEVVGDFQLKQFLKEEENRGHIMRAGLWKYTRHPNYFGEATLWWGIYLIALNVKGGWTTFFGPFLLTFLLLYVSGVPLIESMFRKSPEFTEYAERTHKFIPWFPKSKARPEGGK